MRRLTLWLFLAATLYVPALVFTSQSEDYKHHQSVVARDIPLDIRGSPAGTPVRPFMAAVYETAALVWDPELKKPWLQNMETARQQAQAASAQGADILVLAEYGISGDIVGAEQIARFAVRLPSTETLTVPCDEHGENQEVLAALSCMARDNGLYLVANVMDRQPCDAAEHQERCEGRDELFYNTNVVFDRNGTLIQFYRKINLFADESILLTPGEPRLAAFRTDFGVTFGLMICFDVIFELPGIEMWKRGIDHFAFPTYWGDELPSMAALQMHPAWARGLDVTFLSANIHDVGSSGLGQDIFSGIGSGIFTGSGVLNNTYNYKSKEGALVTARLPGDNRYDVQPSTGTKAQKQTIGTEHCPAQQDDYYPVQNYNVSDYASELITGKTQTTCYGDFCCTITVDHPIDFKRPTCSSDTAPAFRLLAFRGNRNFGSLFAYELCSVVLCANSSLESCSTFPAASQQRMPPFKLSATFSSATYVFPSVILQHMKVSTSWDYARVAKLLTVSDTEQMMIAQLYGRNYGADK